MVLQEQSSWPIATPFIEETHQAVWAWSTRILAAGARPILFQTWADQEGSGQFADGGNLWHGYTPVTAQQLITSETDKLSKSHGIPVVHVGEAFETANSMAGAPNLFSADKHHPSKAGTYLAALCFYRFLTGDTVEAVTYRPPGLSEKDAELLRRSGVVTA